MALPIRDAAPSRVYFDHHVDSRRWQAVPLRPDDIILATPARSGTTWTQRIVSTLLFGARVPPTYLHPSSHWIDARFFPVPLEAFAAPINDESQRRLLKSHVPFDALPYSSAARYICVGRDARDTAISLFNFMSNYSDMAMELINGPAGTFKEKFARPTEFHRFVKDWLTRGGATFPWESDGYPWSSHFRYIQSFWDFRALPNILLVNYADLKTDLIGEARRIADFIGAEMTAERERLIAERTRIDAMRKEADEMVPDFAIGWKGGTTTFFSKGVTGRWKDVFTAEELSLYEAAMKRNLTPDCARWLEQGRLASSVDPSVH